MKRISGIVVLIAALAGIAVGASGASGASSNCQMGFTESRGPSGLTVSGDTCTNARHVAQRAGATGSSGCIKLLDRDGHIAFRKPCVQRRYRCTAVQFNKRRSLRVTCKRDARQIRFNY
jgi:hypothetical protein